MLSALWYTSEQEGDMVDLHMQLGYVALGLVLFRLIWGVVGTKHARFGQFVPSFSTLKRYVHASSNNEQARYAGHNPLGSLMVVTLLFLVLLQALSGLFITDDVFSSGPYYGVLNATWEKVMATIHHNLFDVLLGAIALHIGAVVYYKTVKKKSLVKPMVTGKKDAKEINPGDDIPHSKLIIASIVIAAVICFVYWLVVTNAPVVEELYF